MGMAPPPLERCRVLELGCANGANLLPVAMTYPQARLVGIDLSPRQINDGHALLAELNVSNLELRAMSILDVDESFGGFDYIICHGVFSWVPPEVQEKILAICSRHLSAQRHRVREPQHVSGLASAGHSAGDDGVSRAAVR